MQAIGRQTASKLALQFQQINQLGTGIIEYKNKKVDASQSYASIICEQYHLKDNQFLENVKGKTPLILKLSADNIRTFQIFKQFYQTNLSNVLSVNKASKNTIKSFCIQWDSKSSHEDIIMIIRFLQLNGLIVVLQPKISATATWKQQQQELFLFSHSVLEHQYIVLSAMSIILQLPQLKEQKQGYSIKLLSIWKRTLPAGLGRLIIKDWLVKHETYITKLFLIKNLRMIWNLQFYSSQTANVERLNGEILGLQ